MIHSPRRTSRTWSISILSVSEIRVPRVSGPLLSLYLCLLTSNHTVHDCTLTHSPCYYRVPCSLVKIILPTVSFIFRTSIDLYPLSSRKVHFHGTVLPWNCLSSSNFSPSHINLSPIDILCPPSSPTSPFLVWSGGWKIVKHILPTIEIKKINFVYEG